MDTSEHFQLLEIRKKSSSQVGSPQVPTLDTADAVAALDSVSAAAADECSLPERTAAAAEESIPTAAERRCTLGLAWTGNTCLHSSYRSPLASDAACCILLGPFPAVYCTQMGNWNMIAELACYRIAQPIVGMELMARVLLQLCSDWPAGRQRQAVGLALAVQPEVCWLQSLA